MKKIAFPDPIDSVGQASIEDLCPLCFSCERLPATTKRLEKGKRLKSKTETSMF